MTDFNNSFSDLTPADTANRKVSARVGSGKALGRVKAASRAAAPVPAPVDKSRTLALSLKPDQTEEQALAEILTRGTVASSSTVIDYSKDTHRGLSLTEMAQALRVQGDAVNRGDLSEAERMLNGQAVALNAIFNEMARRAALNFGTYLDSAERYLRLALKAQAQSRATVEALAEMKNPHPVAFVKQANIAHGNQQVNNGPTPKNANSTRTGACAENSQPEPSKLLEASDVERLDTRAPSAASGADSFVETVGALDRAKNGRR
jgi:hypothetical protein